MRERNPERLAKLLRQNHLSRRAAELVARWASFGVSASPVAHDRYWLLIDRLRGGRSWPLRYNDDLSGQVDAFASGCDLITVMGWNVEEEPALLIAAEKVLRNQPRLSQIYPDGYVLINDTDGKALLVDFDDEDGTYYDVVELPASAV